MGAITELKSLPSFVAVTCLALSCCVPATAEQFVAHQDDPVHITLPTSPSAAEQFAANELAHYVNAMTGATWTVGGSEGKTVTISREPGLGLDAFRLRIDAEGIALLGGDDRGTLYAVYELLDQSGCRFFSPGADGEVVPRLASLTLEAQDRLHEPWFVQREIDGGATAGMDAQALVDWSVKNRLNRRFGLRFAQLRNRYPNEPARWNAWTERGGDLQWQWICHNFSFIFPRDSSVFADHPEYFALYKGERLNLGTPDKPHYGGGNLCTTNPDVIQYAAEYAINWFGRNPQGTVVPMWPGDGAIKWCECDNCRALGGINFTTGPEGSMTKRMITFVNAVARLVAVKYPDRLILLPAYANYLLPEPEMTIEPNVLVQYCYHGDYAHGPTQSAINKESVKQMRTWAAQAPGRFGIWEYFLIGDHNTDYPAPVILPLVYRVRDTTRFLKEIGARYYFTQSNSAYMPYNPLLFHATARYLWNPDLDANELIADFCTRYYGPTAGEKLTRYYTLLENAVQASSWQPELYSDVTTPSPKLWTTGLIDETSSLLLAAEATAMTSIQRSRVAMLREAHNFTVQSIRTQTAAGLDRNTPWRLARHIDHYEINADGDDANTHRFEELIQHAIDTGRFDRNFERTAFRAQRRRAPIVFLENDRIQAAIVPEIGGRIVRLIDKASGRNFLKESVGDDTLKTIGDTYFNYGGYEEYAGSAFASPGWEQPYKWEFGEDDTNRWVTLTTEIGDFALTRTCRVPRTAQATISIDSTLTNQSDATRTISLRAHPMFDLGGDSAAYTLHILADDGAVARRLGDEHDGMSVQPVGLWAVANEQLNVAVVNRFEAEQAGCYIFNDGNGRYFNMELMGRPRELAPGASIVLAHSYELLTDAARVLPLIFAGDPQQQPQDPVQKIKPTNSRLDFADGTLDRAGSFDDTSLYSFSSHYIKANAGTIEGWCRLPKAANDTQNAFFVGVGDNNPEWFQISANDGKLSVLLKNGRAPYREEGEYYTSLSADVTNWQADVWHHFAVVWANAGAGRSLVQIYVDGKLKAERYNATLGNRFSGESIAIGRSSASAKTRMTALLDEIRISNYPRTPDQIAQAYQQVSSGKALEPEEGVLLMMHMDGDADGLSRTSLSLDDQTVQLQVQKIVDTICGQP